MAAPAASSAPRSTSIRCPGVDKLFFFFFSYDNTRIREPVAIERWTFRIVLERRENFSQSNDLNNRLIPVRDSLSNAPYPGNTIPAIRANPHGVAIVNIFPEPNFNGQGFNFQNLFTTPGSRR